MQPEENLFDKYVIRSILGVNKNGIRAVHELESIFSGFYSFEDYQKIERLILNKDFLAIRQTKSEETNKDLFLEVMLFSDQDSRKYAVTVFDSIALEQDPQVIEIFPLDNSNS